MQPVLRTVSRASRARLLAVKPSYTYRAAHQSYGNDQSGHPQSDAKNPKEHLEHPGPDPPAAKSSGSDTKVGGGSSESSSQGGSPAIHHPESAAEKDDPEVRKHNEEMRNRAEQTANQLSEDEQKVDKQFWKGRCQHTLRLGAADRSGDVGDPQKRR